MIWSCPNCHDALIQEPSRWYCSAGHSFDTAKQGYANLLLPNQKRSREPGDNREMVISRRRFLQSGHYQALVQAMASLLAAQELHHGTEPPVLLDLGCGEGYYPTALAKALALEGAAQLDLYGLDISREAVKLAARSLPAGHVCIASSYRAPVLDGQVDVALQVFAPADPEEIARLLKARGCWLRVSPGPRHLHQLKAALYDQVREHEMPEVPDGFQLLQLQEVHHQLQLCDAESISDLLNMTPLAWHGSAQGRERLISTANLRTEVHFLLQLMTSADSAERRRD